MKVCFESKGRIREEKEDTLIIDPFKNDFSKIIQSKAYRRLSDKTQVFTSPDDIHIRTRLTHTNEVVATAIAISEQLGLNTELCKSIGSGHDIGHTPYGHTGERVLKELSGQDFGHNIFGVVVAQDIERRGEGLNLSLETLEGILKSTRGKGELYIDENVPEEYSAVMFADKIAYTFADINDCVRYGYLEEVPLIAKELGNSQRSRITNVVKSLVNESKEKDKVVFSEGKIYNKFEELRGSMYENVYKYINTNMHEEILQKTYEFFKTNQEFNDNYPNSDPVIATALLTDREMNKLGEVIMYNRKISLKDINNFGVVEIIKSLDSNNKYLSDIDYTKADLSWAN